MASNKENREPNNKKVKGFSSFSILDNYEANKAAREAEAKANRAPPSPVPNQWRIVRHYDPEKKRTTVYDDLSCNRIKGEAIAYAKEKENGYANNRVTTMEGSESEEEQESAKARDPDAEKKERQQQERKRMVNDRRQLLQARGEVKAAAVKAAKKRNNAKWKRWIADVEGAKQAEKLQKKREEYDSDYDGLVLRDLV